ncbi:hypothetical protein MATL_G00129330 [Megalops atlanticus]|uniref:C2H2-type domain-containing protein n=1 Tax=Megalops atlanticus TaxID=7932 RepID=A0A9D3PXQ5_MEGAT|nr:hypothetical protein MATL_G00129330 [Megalops atlanticus]
MCRCCVEGGRSFGSRLALERQRGIGARGQGARRPGGSQSQAQSLKHAAIGLSSGEGAGSPSGPEGGSVPEDEDEEGGTEECLSTDSSWTKRPRGSAPPREGVLFFCAPCGLSTEDQGEFLQHFPQRRAGPASPQCSRCRTCFASAPSPQPGDHVREGRDSTLRPSQAYSPTKAGSDPTHLTLRSSYSPPRSPSDSTLGEDAKARVDCSVCGWHFKRASDLNTHLHTHGLAFVTVHKADKP